MKKKLKITLTLISIKAFSKISIQKLLKQLNKTTQLSKASDEVKQFFDQEASEAKESVNYSTSSDEEEDDNTDDDNESDKSSDEDLPGVEEDTTSSRKRKCEFSTLDEISSSKKKDTSVVRWLPNGDKVRQYYYHYDNYLLYTFILPFL